MIRIAHLTLRPHQGDARVLRAAGALEAAGHTCPVVAPGFGFHLPEFNRNQKIKTALAFGLGGRLGTTAANAAFFSFAHHRQALKALVDIAPDAIHAHDWDALPIARAASRTLGVPFAFDAHELASHMHPERRLWSLTVAPLIRRLEAPFAREAAFTVAVSNSHGAALKRLLGLSAPLVTIRNISADPSVTKPQLRKPGEPIILHYHGILANGRGIEQAIKALDLLPERFRLSLLGPWRQPAFRAKIEAMVAESSACDRIEIKPQVPHDALITEAARADIGLCMLSPPSPHNAIALPNKIFDYLKAGIPVIGAGSGEFDALGAEGIGCNLHAGTAEELAHVLKEIDHGSLNEMKAKALDFAKANDWPQEAQKLAVAWENVLER